MTAPMGEFVFVGPDHVFRANLLAVAQQLHAAGMAARSLLANWPGTNDEQRRIDWPEFAALEFLATDALSQAERLMALHEREEI
jgi:hypothetical protein